MLGQICLGMVQVTVLSTPKSFQRRFSVEEAEVEVFCFVIVVAIVVVLSFLFSSLC